MDQRIEQIRRVVEKTCGVQVAYLFGSRVMDGRPIGVMGFRWWDFEADALIRYFGLLPMLRQQRREIVQRRGRHKRAVQRYRAALGQTEHLLRQIGAL